MMCPKCGMELKDKEKSYEMPDDDQEISAKGAVLDDLLKMLEGSAGAELGKPEAVSLEVISKKPMKEEDEEEEA